MVTTLLAIAILTCELGAIDNMWSAALLHHSQRSTSAWRTLLVLPVVAQVWFASWGLLQGYLVRSDLFSRGTGDVTPSRRGLSARTANLLFFSGIIFAVALLVSNFPPPREVTLTALPAVDKHHCHRVRNPALVVLPQHPVRAPGSCRHLDRSSRLLGACTCF